MTNQSWIEQHPNFLVHHRFEAQAEAFGEAIAVQFHDQQLTYADLNRRSNQLAHYLRKRGVGPNVLVGLCLRRSPAMLIVLLAVLKAGGAYVPLDMAYPKDRLTLIVQDAKISLLITQTRQDAEQFDGLTSLCLSEHWQDIAREPPLGVDYITHPDDLAYVIYTSGSTGQPKGVMVCHGALASFTHAAIAAYGIGSSDRILQFASISFDAAVEEIYPSLAAGATLVLRDDDMIGSTKALIQACHRCELTVLDLPTAYWHLLVQELAAKGQLNLPASLRLVIIGGEKVNPERVWLWQKIVGAEPRLLNTYGPTEATVVTTAYDLSTHAFKQLAPSLTEGHSPLAAALDIQTDGLPIGRPLENAVVYVMDADQQPVADGSAGELYIGGAGLARGYLNQPHLTRERFITVEVPRSATDLASASKRLYRTGDLVRRLPDGNLQFLGRIDHQVKVRGFRIELGEIESCLLRHPLVKDTVVLARRDTLGNQQLVAYVVTDLPPLYGDDGPINPVLAEPTRISTQTNDFSDLKSSTLFFALQREVSKELRAYLKQRLPDYTIPARTMLLTRMPLTPNGKVDRGALASLGSVDAVDHTAATQECSPTEASLIRCWSGLLNVHVERRDDFFDLGGNSLLAIRLLLQIQETFSVELSMAQLMGASTVIALARLIEGIDRGGASALPPGEVGPDLDAEAVLGSALQWRDAPAADPPEIENALLTGATGFLGVHLLHEVLQQSQAKVYCLIRGSDRDAGQQRLIAKLKAYSLWHEDFRGRIVPVMGDLSQPNLGLSQRQFHQLAEDIDTIYHNGAQVNFTYPFSALRATNVLGTQEIIRLTAGSTPKTLHYISTLSIFDGVEYFDGRAIDEDEPLGRAPRLFSGYAQSKWVAEKLVHAARDRGLSACIYRPAEIVGHSVTGVSSTDDYIARMIKGCLQMGAWPKLDAAWHLTPVDYVSAAIVYLSTRAECANQTFHIATPFPMPMAEVFTMLLTLGHRLNETPYPHWRHCLVESVKRSNANALAPLLPFFAQPAVNQSSLTLQEMHVQGRAPDYSCHRTSKRLMSSGIACPAVNVDHLKNMLTYFEQVGFLQPHRGVDNRDHSLDAPIGRNVPVAHTP